MTQTRRIALVTGGGLGMGRATCQRLARDGMAVGVLDINGDAAEDTAQAINNAGGQAVPVIADISDRGQVQTAIDKVRKALGPITVLVNNAGIDDFTPFAEIDSEKWGKVIDVNLMGAYIVTQTVLPDMVAQNWGRIINFSSIAAQSGAARMVHYSAAKGGIIAMTRSLAQELGVHGITVNAVAPGLIDTPMARRAIDSGEFPVPVEEMLKAYPIPRMGKAEEVAAVCAFFASEEAGYITAQLLGVNGGTAV